MDRLPQEVIGHLPQSILSDLCLKDRVRSVEDEGRTSVIVDDPC